MLSATAAAFPIRASPAASSATARWVNARWRGVPLKAVLDMAGVQAGAKQVTFNGMDGPVSDKTPDFVKALDIDHARDGEVMLAYGMNGDDLPVLNAFRCGSWCPAITAPIG